MTTITEKTYVNIYKAFLLIDVKRGTIRPHERAQEVYFIPDHYDRLVEASERGLSKLTNEQFETACVGEYSAAFDLLKAVEDGPEIDELVGGYFCDFRV